MAAIDPLAPESGLSAIHPIAAVRIGGCGARPSILGEPLPKLVKHLESAPSDVGKPQDRCLESVLIHCEDAAQISEAHLKDAGPKVLRES